MVGGQPLTGIVSISAGGAVTCAVQQGGALYCWGDNRLGQLGNGGVGSDACRPAAVSACSYTPTLATGVNDAAQVSCGERAVCVVRGSKRIWCAGDAADGLLAAPSSVMTEVSASFSAKSVRVGARHACAVEDATNLIACWGRNTRGEIYVPAATASLRTPTPVSPTLAKDVDQVVTGDAFSCHLTGGQASCVGDNSLGQVGVGVAPDGAEHSVPSFVQGLP
jgi:alpha-tubulin suppressor-like RCC1 family protein